MSLLRSALRRASRYDAIAKSNVPHQPDRGLLPESSAAPETSSQWSLHLWASFQIVIPQVLSSITMEFLIAEVCSK